ncbi:hypothetical protein CEP52_006429 [Fusarium oligoseptatum]|uniref:Uncharacterized protein n=1 Tax=Fusarium oligoseptatum TaxID=2604345 RepID=A0A428TT03_9HYPO|nr:hypothetical protein CEP52_006429 [Fusarium oligoseptatum]
MGQPEEFAEIVALSTMPDKDSIVLPNTVLGNCCESTAGNDDVGPLCDRKWSTNQVHNPRPRGIKNQVQRSRKQWLFTFINLLRV